MTVSAALPERSIDVEISPAREPRVRAIRGLREVLERQPELVALAERCGQMGAMDSLKYFLTGPYIGRKVPVLLLVYGRRVGDGGTAGGEGTEELVGAGVVQEYQVLGAGSGVYMTDDETGERTVIARAADRAWVAAVAAEELMGAGARLILLSAQMGAEAVKEVGARSRAYGGRCVWGGSVRAIDQYLPLLETLEATLATLGKHTRRNLRYYRRRAEEKLGCVFVAQMEMSRAEFLAVNRICSYPVPDEIAGWRYDATTGMAGGVFAGVRAGNGDWLSLLGGRHHHDRTSVAWQMNREEMAMYSLSTVMRSYLLEHEVGRGTRKLFFDGGTPHSIHHAFVTAEVAYLVARGQSVADRLLCRGLQGMLPENNFLRRVLSDAGMRWETG